jgi:hypothetical protein
MQATEFKTVGSAAAAAYYRVVSLAVHTNRLLSCSDEEYSSHPLSGINYSLSWNEINVGRFASDCRIKETLSNLDKTRRNGHTGAKL